MPVVNFQVDHVLGFKEVNSTCVLLNNGNIGSLLSGYFDGFLNAWNLNATAAMYECDMPVSPLLIMIVRALYFTLVY